MIVATSSTPGRMAASGATVTVLWASCSIRPHEALGGGDPSPKYERDASATTAPPNCSASGTTRVGHTFGRTCMPMSRRRPVPDVREAVTKSCASTRVVVTRVSRAMTAAPASPIARIADSSEAPRHATMSIASSSVGKAIAMSRRLEIASSSQRFAIAAMRPRVTPTIAAIRTEPNPTRSARRAPTMSCENRSRPRRSVPAQCSAPGGRRRSPVVSSRAYGVQKNDTTAISAMIPKSSAPIVRLTERRARRRRGGAASVVTAVGIVTVMRRPSRVGCPRSSRAGAGR